MKVYIGPFRDWIGPYQIADMIFFWIPRHVDEERTNKWDYKLYDRFGEWLAGTWVNTFCHWLQDNKKRKVKVEIHNYDTWSVDHTLSLITLPLLKQLQEHHHGSPFVDDEDVPEELKSTSASPKENEWDTDDNHHKRWDWVLAEMVWTFEQLCDEEGDLKWYMDGDNINHEAIKSWQDRKTNGLRLFGKYYEALWD